MSAPRETLDLPIVLVSCSWCKGTGKRRDSRSGAWPAGSVCLICGGLGEVDQAELEADEAVQIAREDD